jgi:hypothetical protein
MTESQLNRVIGLAVCTAAYNRSWCLGTAFADMLGDFDDIRADAQWHLDTLGITHVITDHDIAEALWATDYDQLVEELEAV